MVQVVDLLGFFAIVLMLFMQWQIYVTRVLSTFAISSVLIAVALVILLALLTDPFMVWMPTPTQMIVVLVAAILSVVYSGFVLKEQAGDERDTLHRMLAGRAAFLTSVGVLTVALIVQAFEHAIDPWVPAALALTIIAKLLARAWASRNQ